MSERKVIVSISDSDLPAVVSALEKAGLAVDEVLEPIAVVTGTVSGADAAGLQQVPGVQDVELQREVGPN